MLSCVLNIITPSILIGDIVVWDRYVRYLLYDDDILKNSAKYFERKYYVFKILYFLTEALYSRTVRYRTIPNGTGTRTPKQNKITIYRSTLYGNETVLVPYRTGVTKIFPFIFETYLRESYGTVYE